MLNDLFSAGWEAYVDGEKAEIYQANYMFRAVAVRNAGMHKIVFHYRPLSFELGTVITLSASLLFCIVLCFCSMRKSNDSKKMNAADSCGSGL